LIVAALARIVIPETIYDSIPQRPMAPDQFCFYGYNQIALVTSKDHKSAQEITNL